MNENDGFFLVHKWDPSPYESNADPELFSKEAGRQHRSRNFLSKQDGAKKAKSLRSRR